MLEKGSEIGAHILSGAVIDPQGTRRAVPRLESAGRADRAPPVTEDRFLVLTERKAWRIPNWTLPPLMSNHGNYIVSLGNVCRWLASQAEQLGVEIYPGFPAAEVLYDERGAVRGRRDRRHGHRQGRIAQGRLPARNGAATRATRCSPKAAGARCRRS